MTEVHKTAFEQTTRLLSYGQMRLQLSYSGLMLSTMFGKN